MKLLRTKFFWLAIVIIAGAGAGYYYMHRAPMMPMHGPLAGPGGRYGAHMAQPMGSAPAAPAATAMPPTPAAAPAHAAAAVPPALAVAPKVVRNVYGAMAYDPNSGAWGLSAPAADGVSAKKSAMTFCNRFGASCRDVDFFYNTCAAVATGPNQAIAWGKDPVLQNAQSKAMADCAKKAKSACAIKVTNCFK